MRRNALFGIVVAVALTTASIRAEVVPGKWQKVEAQPAGTALNVELQLGEKVRGRLVQAGPSALVVQTVDGERRMDAGEVKKISLSDVKDSSMDGAAVGAVLGALGGLVLGAMAAAIDDQDAATPLAGGLALGAGIGFGAGLALDSARHGEEIIYRAK